MTNLTHRFALAIAVIVGTCAPAFADDPSATGPYQVSTEEYTLGNSTYTDLDSAITAVEHTGVVFYPTDLTKIKKFIVLLHGRHATCADSTGYEALEWPCATGRSPIKSYRGYDYAGQQLASHGYFVISISANGINAKDNNSSDYGALARAKLIQKHINWWRTLNASGGTPFGTKFVGKLDFSGVGVMGHSRGGEGVLRYDAYNRTLATPENLKVIVPIAPTNFKRQQVNNGVVVNQLLPYCDGDVSNIQGLHVYDDALTKLTTSGRQAYVTVMGGNHNYFNTVWTVDDWTYASSTDSAWCNSSNRLSTSAQQSVGKAYLAAFFRTALGETQFSGYTDFSAGLVPSVSTQKLYFAYHANASERRQINWLDASTDLNGSNAAGGTASNSGWSKFTICGGTSYCVVNSTTKEPHTGALGTGDRLRQLNANWGATGAVFANTLSASAQDVSGFDYLDLRVSVDPTSTLNTSGAEQNISVRFTTTAGATQSLKVGDYTRALFFPPGSSKYTPRVWFNTARVPLSALSLDKTKIAKVELVADQKSSGAVLVAEMQFAKTITPSGTVVAPSITQQPANVSVNAGSTATFSVAASGTAPLSYQWSKNNSPISGATSASYTTPATTSSDNGSTFKVTVSNSAGSVTSNTATLSVTTGGEKMVNGGFESGTASWAGTIAVIGNWSANGQPAYEGVNCALMGGKGVTTSQTLYQTVTIPSTSTSATLSFYLHIDTKETTSTAYDKLAVQVRNSSGTVQKVLTTYSNANKNTGYALRTFDISAYKGQTIQICFQMNEDVSLATNFVIDKVSVMAN